MKKITKSLIKKTKPEDNHGLGVLTEYLGEGNGYLISVIDRFGIREFDRAPTKKLADILHRGWAREVREFPDKYNLIPMK